GAGNFVVSGDTGIPARSSGRVLSLVIVVTVLVLPWIHSDKTIDLDLAPKFLAMAVLAFFLQLRICLRPRPGAPFPVSIPLWMFTAYAAVSLLAVPSSVNPVEGITDWLGTAL